MGGTCFNLKEEGLHYSNLSQIWLEEQWELLELAWSLLTLVGCSAPWGKFAALSIDVVLVVAGVGHAVRKE